MLFSNQELKKLEHFCLLQIKVESELELFSFSEISMKFLLLPSKF